MKILAILVVSIACCATVSNALAIGFEVDTPLDPFLGGLSKMKRNLIRRLKRLNEADDVLGESRNDLSYAPHSSISLPSLLFADLLPSLTTQLSPTTTTTTMTGDGRASQLSLTHDLANDVRGRDLGKRGAHHADMFGLGQQCGFAQAPVPVTFGGHFHQQRFA